MDDAFKIYVEQLRDGHIEKISEDFPVDFLGVKESGLSFSDSVHVEGEAYLAEDELVLRFNIKAIAIIPCLICNEPVKVDVRIDRFYHAIPLEQIKSGIYNFGEILREDILINTPHFAECEGGKCPKRAEVKKYLKEAAKESAGESDEGYHPFADLSLDKIKKTKKKK